MSIPTSTRRWWGGIYAGDGYIRPAIRIVHRRGGSGTALPGAVLVRREARVAFPDVPFLILILLHERLVPVAVFV